MALTDIYNVRVRNKRDTEENWEANNPVLLDGESIIVDLSSGGYRRKTGDGTSTYTELSFDDEYVYDAIDDINKTLADLLYEEIAIGSFKNNVGMVENGRTINSATLTWATNKTPATLTLDGITLTTDMTSYTYDGLGITADRTFVLTATDEREASTTAKCYITFTNGVYYGSVTKGLAITSDVLNSIEGNGNTGTISKVIKTSGSGTYTADAGATADNRLLLFAIPTSYKSPVIKIGGFEVEFNIETISHTNVYGYTTDYNIYTSSNVGLGSCSMVIS